MEFDFSGKKVTVMGLGLHGGGVSTVQWLADRGARLTVTDLREKKILQPSLNKLKKYRGISYVLARHRARDFDSADVIIKNPGVPRESPYLAIARRHHIPVETDLSLFMTHCPARVIGVTGTKGKSTTATIIADLLRTKKKIPLLAGNIRLSPLESIDRISKKTPVVLELSSWQLEDMEHLHWSPAVAVITNILPDHLNRYRSLAEYSQSKKIIYKFQDQTAFTVLNRDNGITRKLGKNLRSRLFWFSTKPLVSGNGCFVRGSRIFFRSGRTESSVCSTDGIRIKGAHNLENILAAVTVAKIEGVGNGHIRRGLAAFKGIPDRLETIGHWRSRIFINDTTATTPEATAVALTTVTTPVILIAGGADKSLDYTKFARLVSKKTNGLIFLPGSATKKIVHSLKRLNFKKYHIMRSMSAAVKLAAQLSQRGDTILLSPGAASFGLFLNEFDRGSQFKKAVTQLIP